MRPVKCVVGHLDDFGLFSLGVRFMEMNVVLLEPEIPPNTGNIARLCAATCSRLHLVGPLGFRLDDASLRRAGMDYWSLVEWRVWSSWQEFFKSIQDPRRVWFVEQGGPRLYTEVRYGPDDYLVFGRESGGLPRKLLECYPDQWIRIPMFNRFARSLNLANCVSIVLYEALRQMGFPNEAFVLPHKEL